MRIFPNFLSVIVISVFPCLVLGGPSHRDFDAAMEIHNQTAMKTLLDETQKLYEETAAAVGQLADRAAKGAADRLPPAVISSTKVGLERLSRNAVELQIHGETAGVDYMLRVMKLEPIFDSAVAGFNGSTNGQAQSQRAQLALQKTAAGRTAASKMAEQLAMQNQWQPAFEAINGLIDDTVVHTVFLSPIDQARVHQTYGIHREFGSLRQKITTNRNKLARQDAIAKLEVARAAQAPNTQGLVRELTNAATSLSTNAEISVGGQQLTGPQAMAYFLDEWKKLHVAVLRHRGILWAQRVTFEWNEVPGAPAEDTSHETAYSEFCVQFKKGLVGLIEAEAVRASAAEAPALYSAHVAALAPILPKIADEEFAKEATAALDRLAAKTPDFAKDVQAYRAATDEYLRWRERAYGAIAKAYQGSSPQLDGIILELGKNRENFNGLYEPKDPRAGAARMFGAAPEVVSVLSPQMLENPAWIRDVSGLPNKKVGISRLWERTYATVPWPAVDTQIAELKRELLVTEQLPAQSLAAAAAIASAENGDFASVGGQIKGVYLEGLISRFAAFPDNAWLLVAFGPMPQEFQTEKLLNHVMVRCDLMPAWVQHRYFFVDLNAAQAASAAAAPTAQ